MWAGGGNDGGEVVAMTQRTHLTSHLSLSHAKHQLVLADPDRHHDGPPATALCARLLPLSHAGRISRRTLASPTTAPAGAAAAVNEAATDAVAAKQDPPQQLKQQEPAAAEAAAEAAAMEKRAFADFKRYGPNQNWT
jgi:hypothetical protein